MHSLQGEPVYQNKQEGFHFLPPPNWGLTARAELPPCAKLDKERLLVGYRRIMGTKIASLDVRTGTLSSMRVSTASERVKV